MNADSLSTKICAGLANHQIFPENVPLAAMDRCFTNSSSTDNTNVVASATNQLEQLTVYYMSQLICNARDKSTFALLEIFWKYLQAIFSQSTQAHGEWLDETGMPWPTFSETRWFSKYYVLEKIFTLFPALVTVVIGVAKKKVSPANSSKPQSGD